MPEKQLTNEVLDDQFIRSRFLRVSFGNPIPLLFHATVFLVLIGIAVNESIWVLFGGVFIFLIMATFRHGIIVDVERKIYKKYYGPAPLKFGEWKTLPEPDYLLISKRNKRSAAFSRVHHMSTSVLVYEVDIIPAEGKNITVLINRKQHKAMQTAYYLAEVFKSDILDTTTGENEWMRYNG